MARIRSIKPDFWTSEQVLECSPIARLLFIGIWNFADDAGRLPFSPKSIKAQVFPGDDFSIDDIRGMLNELSANGLILIYSVDDKEYLEVTGWHHQRIDKPQPPRYPAPFVDNSTNAPRPLPPDRIGKDRRGKDKKGKEQQHARETRDAAADADPPPSTAPSKSSFKPDDHALAERIMLAQGLDKHDQRVIGTSYFAVKWREAGWQPDVILTTIERVMAKRTEAPKSLRYFEQAIADAHAELARGVPQGTTGPPGRRKRESFFDLAIELENRSHERAADSTTPAVALIEANAGDRVSDG
jgi:hypothetical protein